MQVDQSSVGRPTDPVLEQIANSNTFDVEWTDLQKRIQEQILAALPLYRSLGQPRNRQSAPSPSDRPTQLTASGSGSGSINLETSEDYSSASQPTPTSKVENEERTPSPVGPRQPTGGDNPSSSPIGPETPGSHDELPEELRPSTPGGLVIPPFPPLDPNRRKKGSATGPTAGLGPQVISIAPRSAINGMGQQSQPIRITSGNVFDDEWDEDIVIGGKKLAGYMEEEEGKKEAHRLIKMLDDLDYPPFTIQRLAELLLNPTLRHKSIGKFLRAVEKTLLAQTPWEAPSYTYVAGTSFPAPSGDSTMPPGMGTPKFSPIPFLRRPSPGADDEGSQNDDMNGQSSGGHLEEGMMSPLVLGDNESYGVDEQEPSGSARSPTPEPEEAQPQSQSQDVEMGSSTNTGTTMTSDPGNQPYLGRVDELDTGPLQGSVNGGTAHASDGGESREEERVAPGTGEGGALTPHGMSERPVPISSTTTIHADERRIASLPSGSSAEGQADKQ